MLRIIAAGTATVLTVLLIFAGYLAVTDDNLVVPSNGVIGAPAVDDPAEGRQGLQALTERTQMQRWREVSGPSPENPEPTGVTNGAETGALGVASPDGRQLVQSWLGNRDQHAEILQDPRFVEGTSSLPGQVAGVFVQPQGRLWRSVRNSWMVYGGAIYLLGVAALLALFLTVRGRVEVKEGLSGETVVRFNAYERANHWMTAASFVVLALTGVIILYGRSIIRPWLGAYQFDTLAGGSAWLHMSLILPFTIGLLVMIALWVMQNLPRKLDWEWLKNFGGFLSEDSPNPPAERFNAGQKLIFWAVILGGLILVASGLAMMFPFLWSGYDGMLAAHSIHAIAALVMIGIIFGHIYIGTIGMVGAFDAMWSGRVDRNWAKEHHILWYQRLFSGGEGSRPQSAGGRR